MIDAHELKVEDQDSAELTEMDVANEFHLSLRRQERNWRIGLALAVGVFVWLPDLYFLATEGSSRHLMLEYGFPIFIMGQVLVWVIHRYQLLRFARSLR